MRGVIVLLGLLLGAHSYGAGFFCLWPVAGAGTPFRLSHFPVSGLRPMDSGMVRAYRQAQLAAAVEIAQKIRDGQVNAAGALAQIARGIREKALAEVKPIAYPIQIDMRSLPHLRDHSLIGQPRQHEQSVTIWAEAPSRFREFQSHTFAVTHHQKDALVLRLIEEKEPLVEKNPQIAIAVEADAEGSIASVTGTRQLYYEARDKTMMPASLFLKRTVSFTTLGDKILFAPPEKAQAILVDATARLDDLVSHPELPLAAKREEFLRALYGVMQAWPFEDGIVEIARPYFFAYHYAIFGSVPRYFPTWDELVEAATLTQSRFLEALTPYFE